VNKHVFVSVGVTTETITINKEAIITFGMCTVGFIPTVDTLIKLEGSIILANNCGSRMRWFVKAGQQLTLYLSIGSSGILLLEDILTDLQLAVNDPAWEDVVLLLPLIDSTEDMSDLRHASTITSPLVFGQGAKFANKTGAYFNGSTSGIIIPNADALLWQSGDYTLETWVFLSDPEKTVEYLCGICSDGTEDSYTQWLFHIETSLSKAHFRITPAPGEGFVHYLADIIWPIRTPFYLMLQKIGTSVSISINGVVEATITDMIMPQAIPNPIFTIGMLRESNPYVQKNINNMLHGLLSNFRITAGTARATNAVPSQIHPIG
jgi:hypothetical protein